MKVLFNNFGKYIKTAEYSSIEFWLFPIVTILVIWLITIIGLKIFSKRKKLKSIFIIHKAWICSSLIVATIIIGLICYWWSINFFSEKPLQLSLLISLFISLIISIISFLSLRRYFTIDNIKEIVQQPKTQNQLEETITYTKKTYRKKKLCYFILLVGFLMLFFVLNKGQNLISIVFDNSGSMESKNATEALSETFDNLDKNNEIMLTTLEGLNENSVGGKSSLNEILAIKKYSNLQAGNVVFFPDPASAKAGLNQISNQCWGSPICESIWKSFLFIKETKANDNYKNKLLIIITDGVDNVSNTILNNKFFFDNQDFVEYFPQDKVFIIDYSGGAMNPFLQKFQDEGCNSYNVTNDKQDYINALDTALKPFKNNWYLIYWTIIITGLMTLIALFIQPKKIM